MNTRGSADQPNFM